MSNPAILRQAENKRHTDPFKDIFTLALNDPIVQAICLSLNRPYASIMVLLMFTTLFRVSRGGVTAP
jgi:hypothetical protein